MTSTTNKVWTGSTRSDGKDGRYVSTGATSVTDASGNDVTAERAEAKAETARKAKRAVSADALIRKAEREAKAAPVAVGHVDRSKPVSEISGVFARKFNQRQSDTGQETGDLDDLADTAERFVVKAVAAEMLALAKALTSEAKRLTAADVRALGNVSGTSVTFSVAVSTGDAANPEGTRKGKVDKRSGSASVRFTPDARGVMGRDLLRAAPKALPKAKAEPTA